MNELVLPSSCFVNFYFKHSLQSSQFEDFVVEFLDRCFAIIENSIILQTRSEVNILVGSFV